MFTKDKQTAAGEKNSMYYVYSGGFTFMGEKELWVDRGYSKQKSSRSLVIAVCALTSCDRCRIWRFFVGWFV